jgi:hypothetical protein
LVRVSCLGSSGDWATAPPIALMATTNIAAETAVPVINRLMLLFRMQRPISQTIK